jgi:hypothetical protein
MTVRCARVHRRVGVILSPLLALSLSCGAVGTYEATAPSSVKSAQPTLATALATADRVAAARGNAALWRHACTHLKSRATLAEHRRPLKPGAGNGRRALQPVHLDLTEPTHSKNPGVICRTWTPPHFGHGIDIGLRV